MVIWPWLDYFKRALTKGGRDHQQEILIRSKAEN